MGLDELKLNSSKVVIKCGVMPGGEQVLVLTLVSLETGFLCRIMTDNGNL